MIPNNDSFPSFFFYPDMNLLSGYFIKHIKILPSTSFKYVGVYKYSTLIKLGTSWLTCQPLDFSNRLTWWLIYIRRVYS